MLRSRTGRYRRAAILPGLLLTGVLALAQAGADLKSLLQKYNAEPDNALLCEQIGVIYAQSDNPTEAARFFRKAVNLNPQRIPARKNLATVLWFAGKEDESEKLFLSLETAIPDDPVPHLYLGLRAFERKDFERAARHFERAGTLATGNPEALPVVIETYLATNRLSAARAAITEALERQPDSSQLWFELGLTFALEGNAGEGKHAFTKARAVDSGWPLPILGLGLIELQGGRAEEAARYFEQAKRSAPNDYRGYYFSAISRKRSPSANTADSLSRQVQDLRHAVQLDSHESKVWTALGKAEVAAGNAAAAEAAFRTAIRLDADDPTAAYSLALLLRKAGRTQESESLMASVSRSKQKMRNEQEELMEMFHAVR